MSLPEIRCFPEIDFDELEDYYVTEIELNGRELEIDLNFESESVNRAIVDKVNRFIDRLGELEAPNLRALENSLKEGGMVMEYLQHHLEVLSEEMVAELIDTDDAPASSARRLFEKLHLTRVGIYPEQEEGEYFAIFDYTIGEGITDEILVLMLNEGGELDYITWES